MLIVGLVLARTDCTLYGAGSPAANRAQ